MPHLYEKGHKLYNTYITYIQLLYKFKENLRGREWPKKIQLDSSNEKDHTEQNNAKEVILQLYNLCQKQYKLYNIYTTYIKKVI